MILLDVLHSRACATLRFLQSPQLEKLKHATRLADSFNCLHGSSPRLPVVGVIFIMFCRTCHAAEAVGWPGESLIWACCAKYMLDLQGIQHLRLLADASGLK